MLAFRRVISRSVSLRETLYRCGGEYSYSTTKTPTEDSGAPTEEEKLDARNEDGFLKNLFARRLKRSSGGTTESQSDLLSNQDDVYEIQYHSVRPDQMANYLSSFQEFWEDIKKADTSANLVASLTCEIGEQDQAIHIWRFPGGYPALDAYYKYYRSSAKYEEFRQKRNQMLQSRRSEICMPFNFWPSIDQRQNDNSEKHIYEMRTYTLKPGTMIEWGNYWAKGIRYRLNENEAVAGLFTHIGPMQVVHHIYCYKNLEQRKVVRDLAWRVPGWDECVINTVPLIRHMKSNILKPTPFSPLQ